MTPEELRHWRKSRGLTVKAMAELVGVTVRSVTRWESGGSSPNGSAMCVIRLAEGRMPVVDSQPQDGGCR